MELRSHQYLTQPHHEHQCILYICQFPIEWMSQHQGLMAGKQIFCRKASKRCKTKWYHKTAVNYPSILYKPGAKAIWVAQNIGQEQKWPLTVWEFNNYFSPLKVIKSCSSYLMALIESQSFLVTMEFIFSGFGLWSNRSFEKIRAAIIS